MDRELKIKSIFYLPMLADETEDEAYDRFVKIINDAGIMENNSCTELEVTEV